MPRFIPGFFAAATSALLLFGAGPARAEVDCAPYCDFTHYYGPHDFTYVRPGLFLYPSCGPSGHCSPYLISSTHPYRGNVTVRVTRRLRPRP